MPSQTETGKAFEYALITAAHQIFSASPLNIELRGDDVYNNAKNCFDLFPPSVQYRYTNAAEAAINHLKVVEPRLVHQASDNDKLLLALQPDSAGQQGDVRDVLFERPFQNWRIGISAKNNHSAVKHSRLSDRIDFGSDWLQLSCSDAYFDTVKPLFQALRNLQSQGMLWKQLPAKHNDYYVPVLNAFKKELQSLNVQHPDVPRLLVKYLLGNNDFYKVIKRARVVEVVGYNLNGSLNKPRPAPGGKSPFNVQQVPLPSEIIRLEMKPGSTNTLMLVCDHGWQISFRIHNAETRVVPSLKFDVKLIGQPSGIYSHHLAY